MIATLVWLLFVAAAFGFGHIWGYYEGLRARDLNRDRSIR